MRQIPRAPRIRRWSAIRFEREAGLEACATSGKSPELLTIERCAGKIIRAAEL